MMCYREADHAGHKPVSSCEPLLPKTAQILYTNHRRNHFLTPEHALYYSKWI